MEVFDKVLGLLDSAYEMKTACNECTQGAQGFNISRTLKLWDTKGAYGKHLSRGKEFIQQLSMRWFDMILVFTDKLDNSPFELIDNLRREGCDAKLVIVKAKTDMCYGASSFKGKNPGFNI